jgi:hypothetical protein
MTPAEQERQRLAGGLVGVRRHLEGHREAEDAVVEGRERPMSVTVRRTWP